MTTAPLSAPATLPLTSSNAPATPHDVLPEAEQASDEEVPQPARPARGAQRARRIDPVWSLRPTRWQLVRAQLGVAAAILVTRDPSVVGVLIAAALLLSALPFPDFGVALQTRRHGHRGVEQPANPGWLNPVDHVLPELVISAAPGVSGGAIAIVRDGDAWVAAVQVTTAEGGPPTAESYEDVIALMQAVCDHEVENAVVQMVLTLRDVPSAAIPLKSDEWVDPDGNLVRPTERSDAFKCSRCTVVVRLDDSASVPQRDSAHLGTARGRVRRVVLEVTDTIASHGFRAEPLSPHRFRETLEVSSAGPELDYSALDRCVDLPESNDRDAWCFGDRRHVSFEVRRCGANRLGDLLSAVERTHTAAAIVSFSSSGRSLGDEIPPRRPGVACSVRLTDVDEAALDTTCRWLEERFDEADIRWHRLDGWHRVGYLCSLQLGRRLPAGRPRLSWRSVSGRSRRSVQRQDAPQVDTSDSEPGDDPPVRTSNR